LIAYTLIKMKLKYINPKTLYFNLKYFPFKKAIKLPVFLSWNTKLRNTGGTVILPDKVKTGMIIIGTSEIGHFDKRHHRPVWENKGTIIFRGKALIKYGAKIIVGTNGLLEIDNNLRMTSSSFIICYKHVKIGRNCRISWETQIIDTDFHCIYDELGNILNPNKEIIISDNC
jgi:hypothetical protein